MSPVSSIARFLLFASASVLWCNSSIAKPPPVVFVPTGATNAMPVMVWLHGYRAFPSVLSDKEYFQGVADRLQIAVVGIPGTTTLSDETYVWSEEPVADHFYIQDVLAAVATEHKLDLNRVGLFGFSEGAMVAADIATRYPGSYRGAVILSPGGITQPKPATKPAEGHKRQVYFLSCGSLEHPGNVKLTRYYAGRLQDLGATVAKKEYEGIKEHTRPPDFKERFPEWTVQILGLKEKAR